MHQQARHPPRGASPASSPQANPSRTNNSRDTLAGRPRPDASRPPPPGPSIDIGGGLTVSSPRSSSASPTIGGPTRDSVKKLDQIIQNFFLKAAVLIIQARIPVTPSGGSRGRKVNKWFQIETDDIDNFKDELRTWKHCGSFDSHREPLVIETYIDASRLSPGQTLVVLDENGKRWDALEALNSPDPSNSGTASSSSSGGGPSARDKNKIRKRSTEIILERWKVELQSIPNLLGGGAGDGTTTGTAAAAVTGLPAVSSTSSSITLADDMEDFGPILPTIYKRSIVFFRSLFVTTHVLPTFRLSRQASTKGVHPALAVRCRVLTGADAGARINATGFDNLRQALFHDGARDPVTDYMFGDLEVPVGRFSASVTYRNDCSFRIDDAESVLSSRFMGLDENYFRPSIPAQRPDYYIPPDTHRRHHSQHGQTQTTLQQQQQQQMHLQQQLQLQLQNHPHADYSRRDADVGSLPSRHTHQHYHQHGRNTSEQSYRPQPQQTYGSLNTFHGAGALGTSPLTALKSVRPIGSESSSPTDSIRPSSLEQSPRMEPPHSLPITGGPYAPSSSAGTSASARPLAFRNLEGTGGTGGSVRRTSISFQPFKAGSLSGSPRTTSINTQEDLSAAAAAAATGVPSSPLSGSRPSSGLVALAQARNRNSLTAGMAASLRGAPQASTSVGSTSGATAMAIAAAAAGATGTIEPSQSPSPRPGGGSRYSSSFTHRRGRSSFGGTSRADDDQGSSGKQSLASSMAQPGSGLLAEAAGLLGGLGGTSSGSFQADDDNISEFLKALESKKTLQSFETSASSSRRNIGGSISNIAARRAVAQLSHYQMMRESNIALTDSMSLSMQIPTSGVSGASGTTSVSGASAASGPSMSVSMSPIKPQSPHTPHTPHMPAVPSRLSENAVIDYHRSVGQSAGQGSSRNRSETGGAERSGIPSMAEADETDEGNRTKGTRPVVSGGRGGPVISSSHSNAGQSGSRGVTAIDIPLSPRLRHHHQEQHEQHASSRRSSSAAQKRNTAATETDNDVDELAVFGAHQQQYSLSLGAGRTTAPTSKYSGISSLAAAAAEPPSLSALFRMRSADATASGAGASSANTTSGEGSSAVPSPTSRTSGSQAMGSIATALRSTAHGSTSIVSQVASTGTSPRRRYMSRQQQQLLQEDDHRKEGTASINASISGTGGGSGSGSALSERPSPRPALSSSSRASISGSYLGRYGARRRSGSSGTPGTGVSGADGEADDEPLVFDLFEINNRRSLEETRATGGNASGNARCVNSGHDHHVWQS